VAERKIEGTVQSIDSFGNLVTSIPADALMNVPRGEETAVVCDEHETRGIFSTYEEQPPMTLVAVVGDSGKLELAIVGDSAAIMLGVSVGTPVSITW
jgi:S-adenosyl-L-methionine hydrolase (adenosine-forming)